MVMGPDPRPGALGTRVGPAPVVGGTTGDRRREIQGEP